MDVLTLGCLARVKAMVSTRSLLCPRSIGGIQLSRAGGQLDNSRRLVDRSALGVRFQLMLWRL